MCGSDGCFKKCPIYPENAINCSQNKDYINNQFRHFCILYKGTIK